jgi:carboxylesterase
VSASRYMTGAEPFSLEGGRAAVLLLHGFSGSVSEIRELGGRIREAGFSVFAPSLAGHGSSPDDLARATREDFFSAVEDAYQQAARSAQRVYVVGLSMGGALGLHVAARHPVAAIVTISTPVFMGKLVSVSVPLLMRWVPHRQVISNYAAWRGEVVGYKTTPLRSLGVFLDVLKHVRRELPRVVAPLLVLHSKGDQTAPATNARFIAAHVGSEHKQVRVYPGGRHLLTIPPDLDRVSADILEFLNAREAHDVSGAGARTRGGKV